MADHTALVSKGRRIPAIWFVPIVAGVLGIWMVIYTMMNEGPTVRVTFATAEGIEAGKTKIKALSVEVGLVEQVLLNEDLASVTVVAKLDPEAVALLRDDSRFWVVRPRLGAEGVSGLGTIMSGAYLELQPGPSEPSNKREFVGLENVPVTPVDAPGLWLTLIGGRGGALSVGQPLLFGGYPVGRIEERRFDTADQKMRYTAFVEEQYADLVDRASRFWDASGVSFSASADGVKVDVGSLQTLLIGGVAFEIPEGRAKLGPAPDGAEFKLYDDHESTTEAHYNHALEVVIEFDQSIRGLVKGAPVEYRGRRIGSVVSLLTDEFRADDGRSALPILIELEPARLGYTDGSESVAKLAAALGEGVKNGLRATLETGNLLTGSLFVSLDFFTDAPRGEVGSYGSYMTMPTRASGLEGIGRQVTSVLSKVNDLPIDKTISELNRTLVDVRRVLASKEVEELPGNLNASLEELSRTLESFSPGAPVYDQLDRAVTELTRALQSVEDMSRTVAEQPNAVVFDKPIELDRQPRGAQ